MDYNLVKNYNFLVVRGDLDVHVDSVTEEALESKRKTMSEFKSETPRAEAELKSTNNTGPKIPARVCVPLKNHSNHQTHCYPQIED